MPTCHFHILWWLFVFSGAPLLQSLSLPLTVEVLHYGSAPNPLSCMMMREWEEGFSVPWERLDCCTERRVKLLSSSRGYWEEMRTVEPLWAETHVAGKAQHPRHQTECARSPHKETEQPQPQLHLKPLQPHLPVGKEMTRITVMLVHNLAEHE